MLEHHEDALKPMAILDASGIGVLGKLGPPSWI